MNEIERQRGRDGERGSALILALMVALVLAFLGMGLLLQTSLGLQASSADRWVAKSMHAAEAGVILQLEMVQLEQLAAPTGGFTLQEDMAVDTGATGAGLLRGQYQVNVSALCEVEPASPAIGWEWPKYGRRYFHVRSEANRNVGHLVGLTQAAIEADISVWPFEMAGFTPVTMCN
jgi:Tfp pilus assembly protein PilX